jgi:hypothetical protein
MIEHDDEHDPEDDNSDPNGEHLIEGMFVDLGEAEAIEPRWVIKDLVPVGMTILGGPPKDARKSTLTMVWAALVAELKPRVFPSDLSEVPSYGRVMAFSYEASAGELKQMMEQGIHVKVPSDGRILVCQDPWAWRLDEEGKVDELLEILSRHRPRMVIMDPFRDMHDLEEKDSGSMIRLLRPLQRWAVENEAALVLVHHARKLAEESKEYTAADLRGSSAIFGKADAVLMVTPRIDGKVTIKAVFKRGKSWDRTMLLALYDVKGEGTEALSERDELVLQGIKARGTLDQIARQLRIGKAVVVACCERLERNKYIKKEGKKWLINRKKSIVR